MTYRNKTKSSRLSFSLFTRPTRFRLEGPCFPSLHLFHYYLLLPNHIRRILLFFFFFYCFIALPDTVIKYAFHYSDLAPTLTSVTSNILLFSILRHTFVFSSLPLLFCHSLLHYRFHYAIIFLTFLNNLSFLSLPISYPIVFSSLSLSLGILSFTVIYFPPLHSIPSPRSLLSYFNFFRHSSYVTYPRSSATKGMASPIYWSLERVNKIPAALIIATVLTTGVVVVVVEVGRRGGDGGLVLVE